MSARIAKVYAQAFTGDGARVHGMLVDEGGELRVWDEIAGHWTVCHSLSEGAIRRITEIARGQDAQRELESSAGWVIDAPNDDTRAEWFPPAGG